ncbi:MAG: T9SS type A sorting domain-containing protein [bacterium]|nr:T9SS type A sorting domain-containing protein [bacterium]
MRFILLLLFFCAVPRVHAQLFQEDFGTAFASIDATRWPTSCRNAASSFNTSVGSCAAAGDYNYGTSGFGTYITSQAIAIPATGYELTFDFSFNNTFSFPAVEIRTGGPCGTTLAQTETLSNTSGTCTPHSVDLSAYSGQTIYLRFRSNTSSVTTYWDNILVDLGSGGGGGGCLLEDDFGTAFASIDATNWPGTCTGGSASSFNTSVGSCSGAGDYGYGLSGFGSYITSMALAIPSTGYELTFEYSFNNTFGFPAVEIRTGGPCGTTLAATNTLTNTSGVCTPHTINLDSYAGQTIYLRFRSNTSSVSTYFDDIAVCGSGGGPSGDFKWADNFNDNDLNLNYPGNDGDEACTGCGPWTLNGGASLALAPSGGWQGNSNETEAFPDNMANVYYVRLDRNEWIESPTIDMSAMESLKISFYAKSSSSGTGGGDSWSSFSDHLRLQIWDGSSWITVKDITEGTSVAEDQILPALPLNYFCFTAYNSTTSPGNYYYNSAPNVNSAYFHADFKFRVIFEGGFSGAPFAWVDDFTFRADADGYSTMIPCGISFWNQPAATSYGQDPGTTGNNNAEKGVELELDNSINIPPNWATEADDGDTVTQVFGLNESERVVFAVISEQEINFAFPVVHFYAPDMGWQSSVMSIDNNYTGPGWRYYAVEYISCDLAGGSIAAPTDDYRYYFSFEYGNEFIPVFYHLNTSGIETGGGATSTLEVFNAPDVISTDNCGAALGVELTAFDATLVDREVLLNWTTNSEWDNDYFDIEKSVDAENYISIGRVQGQGTKGSPTAYLFKDETPISGTNYYRLKQVDFDGTTTYSDIRTVVLESEHMLYPNPVKDLLILQSNDAFSITDVHGRTIEVPFTRTTKHTQIDVRNLSSGIYCVNVNGHVYRFVKK